MTLEEYLDPARFPATSQKGISPKGQLMIDAVNYDQLKHYLEDGNQLDESQSRRWEELQAKMKDNARLAAELAKAG